MPGLRAKSAAIDAMIALADAVLAWAVAGKAAIVEAPVRREHPEEVADLKAEASDEAGRPVADQARTGVAIDVVVLTEVIAGTTVAASNVQPRRRWWRLG